MAKRNTSNFKVNPNVSVDCVVFGFDGAELKVLLVQRDIRDKIELNHDTLVLPGDLIRDHEKLNQSAARVLKDLTGMRNVFLEQIGAFGDPDRLSKEKDRIWLEAIRQKPDARVITVGFFALVNIKNYKIKPAGFAKHLMWADFKEVGEMGFDHNDILKAAIHRLRNNLYLKPVGFELLPEEFSLHQLYTLYNEIMDEEIDRRNFRRKMLHTGFLLETDNFQTGVPHKPARLYRFVKEEYENTAKENFKFF